MNAYFEYYKNNLKIQLFLRFIIPLFILLFIRQPLLKALMGDHLQEGGIDNSVYIILWAVAATGALYFFWGLSEKSQNKSAWLVRETVLMFLPVSIGIIVITIFLTMINLGFL